MRRKEGEGQGVYAMSVTAVVFHLDKFPLNDDAPKNIILQAGRQGCTGDAAVRAEGPTNTHKEAGGRRGRKT
jgi:hypothetical protein